MTAHPCAARHEPDARCLMLRPALAYADGGWPVFPCRADKKPYTSHGFHDATIDRQKLVGWWKQWPGANIGVPTGTQTGCFVLDVDEGDGKHGKAALAELVAEHGPLPQTREVQTPRGGRHLYFKHAGERIRNRMDYPAPALDIRGDGGYVLVPPSKTKHGQYTYIREGPVSESPVWFLDLLRNVTEKAEIAEKAETSEKSNEIGFFAPFRDVADLIQQTQPTKTGQRHRKVFDLVRGLKLNLNMGMSDAKTIVKEWHRTAYHVIGTKAFTETWSDVVSGWPLARVPLGMDVVSFAWAEAAKTPMPDVAKEYEDMNEVGQLVALCAALDRLSGGKPFFLSTRSAGRVLKAPPMSVSRWLKLLVVDGVLMCTDPGTPGPGGHAARFKWTAPGANTK